MVSAWVAKFSGFGASLHWSLLPLAADEQDASRDGHGHNGGGALGDCCSAFHGVVRVVDGVREGEE